MKEAYQTPEMERVEFKLCDIISTSSTTAETWNPNPDNGWDDIWDTDYPVTVVFG